MDLAQKSTRAKRDLAAAVAKPEATSLRHAVESFDAFVDAVVDEIDALKAAAKKAAGTNGDAETTADSGDTGGSMDFPSGDAGSAQVDVASTPTPAT